MSSRDKKVHKTVRLDPSIFQAIETYKGIAGKDRSGAIEELIARGLERTEEIESIQKKLSDRMSKLEKRQKEDTERIVNLIIGLSRIEGRIYGHTSTLLFNSYEMTKESLESCENNGIKKVMSNLKWKNKETDYEEG